MSPFYLIVSASAGFCVIFVGFYALARQLNNYGIVDIVWSYSFAGLGLFYAFFGKGWPIRRALIATLVTVWSLRLGTHLYRRVTSHHPTEDGRYAQLRKDWAGNFAFKMGAFFQMQALSVVLLGSAFLVVSLNPERSLNSLELGGTALWLVALTGEAVADAQLAAFKRDKTNRGRVCDIGLWHYSRHPNYFFEWLVWVAFFVFALGSPWGWVGAIGPLSILYLLLCVTGIPLTEEQSLRSKGEAYRRYQKTTNAFVPWAPRKIP